MFTNTTLLGHLMRYWLIETPFLLLPQIGGYQTDIMGHLMLGWLIEEMMRPLFSVQITGYCVDI